MSFLIFPDPDFVETSGYASVAHVPFLIGSDGTYLREPNRYLRERALLEWMPASDERNKFSLPYPTVTTLKNIGDKLKNFLEWCQFRNLDWRDIKYTEHLILGYQRDMDKGKWSVSRTALSPRTINQRVSEATTYLRWAAERGERPPLYIPARDTKRKISSATQTSSRRFTSRTRGGKAPERITPLHLPTPEQVGKWLSAVYSQRGYVKGLCCELIVSTAIRLRECIEWRTDTLPENPADWHVIDDNVQVTIKYGTKGHKASPDSIIGPSRPISIPLRMAMKLHEYRAGRRLVQQTRWARSGGTKEIRDIRRKHPSGSQLFLGEHSNCPFSSRMLRYAWSGAPLPFKGWSPHVGRHYWACTTLLDLLQQRVASLGKALNDVPGDWLTGTAQSDLVMVVRPQLGHIDPETTLLYLAWLRKSATVQYTALSYVDFLEDGCG